MKVAVYWTLKKWWWNHVLLHKAEFIWEAFVKCYWIHWRWFPIANFVDNWKDSIELQVEIYNVDNGTLSELDRLEWANQWRDDWYSRIEVTTTEWNPVQIYSQNVSEIDYDQIESVEGNKYTWK